MIEAVPAIANCRKTEMLTSQMTEYVLGVFPGLAAMAEAAEGTRHATFFVMCIPEEGSENLSSSITEFLSLHRNVRERTYQRL